MKKGFTLIELLAVIVVLAILALVVTPIVLNIVENAQQGSDERSLEQYAKIMQTSYYEEKMKDPTLTLASFVASVDTGSGVSLTYNGSKVVCETRIAKEVSSGKTSIELYNCMVDGRGPYNFVDGKASKNTNVVYADGSEVYFDVANGKICNKSNYHSDNSLTDYNGLTGTRTTKAQTSCLKFYAFNDSNDSKKLNLILDHNTSSNVSWSENENSKSGPTTLLTQLKNDTKDWKGTIEPENYTLDQSGQTSTAKYTINYDGYKARLITANEIAEITGNKKWNEKTATSMYYLKTLTNMNYATPVSGAPNYSWLHKGITSSCDHGYWTATSRADEKAVAWYINNDGRIGIYSSIIINIPCNSFFICS